MYGLLRHLLSIVLCAVALAAPLQVVTENWRPYNYEENGVVKGQSTDIVRLVLDRSGLPYTIDVLPWARAYQYATTKPDVLIYTIIRIPPREGLFKWIGPLGPSGTTSLYRRRDDKAPPPRTLDEAKQLDVVTNRDSMDHQMLEHLHFPNITVAPSVESAIKMFFAQRTRMIAVDDAVLGSEFEAAGFHAEGAVAIMPLFKTPPYLAVSKQTSDETVRRIRDAYEALVREGKIGAFE
ncbi:MAG: transporter substrate-binding domain-containing protein [Burkholderiales bacterium]|nr:transporter substrate-binding domain-containing protein [Burkholderiales bacterium]